MQLLNKISVYIDLFRLRSPTGFILLFLPCSWGISLASPSIDPPLLGLFLVGSIVMRASGCIINDIFDRNIDKKVSRTKNRPLASGKVSIVEALIILCILLLIGLCILLSLSPAAITLGLSSLIFVILYPLMKRVTYLPQFFLGLTFNYGILIGYAAIANQINLEAIYIYIASIFWTAGYDTIYGFQDIKDDKKINIKSTSIKFEKHAKPFILTTYSIFIVFILLGIFTSNKNLSLVSIGCITLLLLHLFWQTFTLQISSPSNCLARFKANTVAGALVFLIITFLTK